MKPRVHLRNPHDIVMNQAVLATCGIVVLAWTDDPQAVNCPNCIDRMDLQPA